MPGGKLAATHKVLNFVRKCQKAHHVCDVTAAFSKCLSQFFLSMAKPINELSITLRFFHGVEIGTLDVFDDGDLQNLDVIEITDHDRQFMKLNLLCRTPAPFACNNLICIWAVGIRSHDQGLDHAFFTDRRSKFVKRRLCKASAWLIGVGVYPINRNAL